MFCRSISVLERIHAQLAVCLALCLMLMATTVQAQVCPEPFEFAVGTNLSQFGGSIASAGDVNGDGFEDIIVGASEDDAGFLVKPGRAFVFFGGPNADAVPDMTMTGDKDTQWFGRSVDGIGDYNGDGFDDVIVGAPGGLYAQPLGYPGDAYIYFGGPNPDSTADIHLSGENNGDSFGEEVAGIGDFNADGHPDIMIGAIRFDNDKGKVYVYYGGPGADLVADLSFVGSVANEVLGSELCAAGDMNGDGFVDCTVGVQGYDHYRGRTFVFFGGPTPNLSPDMVCTGTVAEGYFGRKLRGVGDINDDGFDDLAVGSYKDRVDIFFGAQFLPDNVSDLVFLGPGDAIFGSSISTTDVNGDGYSDLVIGETQYGDNNSGRIHVFHAGPLLDLEVDLILDGGEFSGGLGFDAASNIDWDADGREDIISGAHQWRPEYGASPVGAVYIFPGTLFEDCDGNQIPDQCEFADGTATDCNDNGTIDSCDIGSGTSNDCNSNGIPDECEIDCNNNGIPDDCDISGGSSPDCNSNGIPDECELDCNGNGIPDSCDLVSGFSKDCDGTGVPDECEAAAIGFDCNANGIPDYCDIGHLLSADGVGSQSEFGHDLATGGDFNGDGFEDLLVGAASEHAHAGPGIARLFAGGPGLSDTPEFQFSGESTGDEFGISVDFIGDFNGDGEDDLIIGAPGNDFGPQEGGRAYIHYGGPSANTSADVILVNPGGGGFGNNLGKVVAGAGDVNGDGYDDVLVGAPGSTQSNRMYLYLGGSGYSPGSQIMPSNTYGTVGSDWTFPAALAGAGDINGDMYADVLVGAYNASSGIGQVEVMLGGPSGLSNLITLSQQSLGDRFGFAVGFAGDQNADGVDDVLVGAPFESSEGLEKGRVYLFHGGSGMDGGADLEFFPPSSPSMPMGHFGISVAGGRDLNADGLADIMIGQSAVRNGGSVGRAYVFFGKAGGDVVLDRLVMGVAVGGELGRDVGLAGDLNGDGLADFVVGAPSAGSTGRIDVYDVRATTFLDCNENGIGDACDIESGFSSDVNNNGIPDACEATATLPSTHRGQLLLRSAYPNPFNPTTVIAFDVPVAGRVQLSIYDLSGRRIRSLVSETMDMGSHRVQWAGDNDDGRGVASGVYIARLSLGAHGGTFAPSMMKLMLLK